MGGAGAALPDPTLYLFDGYNLLHAGEYGGVDELVDRLASFVALQGARGVVVFDGHGEEREDRPLQARYTADADTQIERAAAQQRRVELDCSSAANAAIDGTAVAAGVTRISRVLLL